MLKKCFLQLCIVMVVLGSFLPSTSAEIIDDFKELPADPNPVVDSTGEKVTGEFVMPDTDIDYEGMTYIEKLQLFEQAKADGGESLGHTGFAMSGYPYSDTPVLREDGTTGHFLNGEDTEVFKTDHGHIDAQDYRAKDFTAEQLGLTPEEYANAVAADIKVNIKVDSRENGSEDKVYSEMYVPTAEEIQMAKDLGLNPMALYYRDNDVVVNFEIPKPPPVPDVPSGETREKVVYVPPTWGTGEVSWGMFKDTLAAEGSSDTKIRWTNGLVAGGHYAQTPSTYAMSGIASSSAQTLDTEAGDKGAETYSLNYNYTDYREDTYTCKGYSPIKNTDGYTVGWSCDGWVYSSSAPYWQSGSSYSCSVNLAVDHRYGETFEGEHGFNEKMNIGRSASVAAENCSKAENEPNIETITHESQAVELDTQTYVSFMEKPFEWTGSPMYNNADIFPYVKGENEQGFVGVPELDVSFKKLNKYTTQHEGFDNPYAMPLRNAVEGTTMNVYSREDFWVSRSTGLVTSTEHGTALDAVKAQAKTEYDIVTGQAYRDEILNREDLTSVYYLPIDANDNVMTPNTDYKMETQLNGLGYNNITVLHDQTYKFKNYLIGSVFEEDVENEADFKGVWIVEQNEIPYNDVTYAYSATVTPEQGATINKATEGRTNFIFGHKGTDNMAVYDKLNEILGNNFGEKLATSIPHVNDRESANETL